MIPALALGGYALGAIYTAGKAYDSVRFWSDYRKNTGYSPRYPWHAGMYDWVRDASRSLSYGYNFYSKW